MTTVAFITGGGGDIGRATAGKLARQGHHIVSLDINPDGNQKTVDTVRDMGGHITAVTASVTEIAQVENAVKIACDIGHVAVIVNNAGMASAINNTTTSYEQWRFEQELNLNSVFIVIKAFERHLINNGQCAIVNISSVNGLGAFGNTAYSVAKAGIIHYTRQLATEFGKYNVRVNCITPGTVRTQAWNQRVNNNPAVWDEVTQWYALERVAYPSDIASAVGFLSSAEANAITGVILPVDCGLTAGVKKMADSFCQDDF